jgi:hypothetical protein
VIAVEVVGCGGVEEGVDSVVCDVSGFHAGCVIRNALRPTAFVIGVAILYTLQKTKNLTRLFDGMKHI